MLTEDLQYWWAVQGGGKMVSLGSLILQEGEVMPTKAVQEALTEEWTISPPVSQVPGNPSLKPHACADDTPGATAILCFTSAARLAFKTTNFNWPYKAQTAPLLRKVALPHSAWRGSVPETQLRICAGAWSLRWSRETAATGLSALCRSLSPAVEIALHPKTLPEGNFLSHEASPPHPVRSPGSALLLPAALPPASLDSVQRRRPRKPRSWSSTGGKKNCYSKFLSVSQSVVLGEFFSCVNPVGLLSVSLLSAFLLPLHSTAAFLSPASCLHTSYLPRLSL